ncbi:MAG: GNAT family N-acetyltransferase [Patescibacteria group bacterium]|nr:GNAT family N-acetyltransferase [Patescibacteria group bacterium]
MKLKIFNGREIKIKELSRKDLRNVRKFRDFINSLIDENAQILMNKRFSLSEERKWLEEQLRKIKNRKTVFLAAEYNNTVIGTTGIDLLIGRQSHIGNFGITIRKDYRRISLGSYLLDKIIKLAKKVLKPQPKIIRLNVFSTNKPAIKLYKKYGFKIVAKIPKQIEFKGKLVNQLIMLREL